MKKLFVTAAAVVALASTAGAADLAVKARPYAPPPPACAQFGGFYLGINGGWAYHDKSWVDRDAWVDNFGSDWALGTVNSTRNGGTAGGQIGYNWQRNCTVFGIELDANWVGISNSKSYSPVDGGVGTVLTLDDNVKWFGTARARTGIVVDDVMLYVTGGLAYANIKHDFTVTDPGTPTESFSSKHSRWGWVGGVGAEWAWTQSVSIKTEVLYVRFSEVTTTGFSPAGPGTVNFDNQDSMWVSRVGINFKFGAPAVAARY